MTLEEAINKLVLENGEDYIANPDIVKSLSRKRVFSQNPELKDIYLSLINVGYAHKLLELMGIYNCEEEFNELANNFYRRLSYSWEGVSEVFDAISSAIGLTAGETEDEEEFDDEDSPEEDRTEYHINTSDSEPKDFLPQHSLNYPSAESLRATIKMVIATNGAEIIKDARFINILSDFKAFDDFPSSRYILKAIITDGYASKLISIGQWNAKTIALCQRFISTTGFQPDFVDSVFQSLVYGLGYIDSRELKNQASNRGSQVSRSKTTNRNILQKKKLSKDDYNSFLLGLIEWKTDFSLKYGITIDNISFEVEGEVPQAFDINAEINGFLLESNCDIWAVFYDKDNRIRKKENLIFLNDSYVDFTVISQYIELGFPIRKLSRIVIYAVNV